MGASHSIVGDQDQSVPVELIIRILSYLAVADLTSCRCINHTLHDIIDTSPHLQHQINTALGGVVDNYNITLPLPERRRALRLRQEAWDSCKPRFTNISKVSCFPDLIQDSIYFKLHHPDSWNCVGYYLPPPPEQSFDPSWSYLSHLPKRLDCEIIALAVCLEGGDLVAVGVRHGNIRTPPSNYYVFEVDLLCFSSGGGAHPSAREPTIFVRDVREMQRATQATMEMEIRADLLAVLLKEEDWAMPEFLIFDWKTAQNIVRLTDEVIDAFRFLSDKVIVVANVTHRYQESLDLFTVPEPQGDTGGTPMTKVAELQLPDTDCIVTGVTFCNPPAKNGIPRSGPQDGNVAVPTKPFTNSPNNIIYCCITVTNTEETASVSLVVHSSTLLRYATSQDFKFIGWSEWSPMARCVRDWDRKATAFSGQRWLRWRNEIWDFNQYRVKRLGRGFAAEVETARISVVTKASEVEALEGHIPFYSGSLPYVRTVQERWAFACLDDDRIFTSTPGGEIEHLYFG